MILWGEAQLSPALAPWLSDPFGDAAYAVRDLGLREGQDLAIFHAAREAGAVIMGQESDVVLLLERFAPPPQMLGVTCGHTSKARMRAVWPKSFPAAKARLEQGEPLVELSEAR